MNKCKSCGQEPPSEYLLVSATGNSSNDCGNNGKDDCKLSDGTFDESISDFVVPGAYSSVSMQVCDPSLYSIGQWLFFFESSNYLRVTAVDEYTLTLENNASTGIVVDGNKEAGFLIRNGSRFNAADRPFHIDGEILSDKIIGTINSLSEIEAGSLAVSSTTAVVHPIGRVESDPSNSGVKKAIRRIYGVLFKAGTPILSALKVGSPSDVPTHQRLYKNKTTGEVKTLPNYSEYPKVVSSSESQFALSITSNEEKLISTFFPKFYQTFIEKNGNAKDNSSWPTLPGSGFSKTFDITSPEITDSMGNPRYIWVVFRVEVGIAVATTNPVIAETAVNGKHVCYTYADDDGSKVNFNQGISYIKVARNDLNVKLTIDSNYPCKYFYRLSIEKIFI